MKIFLTTITLLVAVSETSPQASAPQTSAACSETALPAPVNELLKTKFARWRPERVSDLEGDDQKFWLEEHRQECPGIAVGHFESAGSLSYAVLLVPTSQRLGGYQILVFSKAPSTDAYTWRLLQHAEGKDKFAPVIYKVPPGKYSGFDDSRWVLLKLDGVNVEWIKKSSFILYWLGGRYHKIWTSD
jgi:hypothetical protein